MLSLIGSGVRHNLHLFERTSDNTGIAEPNPEHFVLFDWYRIENVDFRSSKPSLIEGVDSRWSILFGTTFCLQWGVVDRMPKVPAALTFAGMHLANELVVSVSDLPLV